MACQPHKYPGRPPLEELKEMYGKTAHAYEWNTRGMGKGKAVITPAGPVTVNAALDRVVITYHPPGQGMAPGGKVSVCIPAGMTTPQLQYKDSAGYVAVHTTAGVAIDTKIERTGWHKITESDPSKDKPYHWLPIFYRVVVAGLPEGLPGKGFLTFTCLDTKVDRYARRYEGDHLLFRVYADHDADGFAEEIEDSPAIPKIADKASRIMLRCQSTTMPGEPVRMTILALDHLNNPAVSYRGTVQFRSDQQHVHLPEAYTFEAGDRSSHRFEARFEKPGFYWIEALDEKNGFHARSNPVQVFENEPGKRLYWGDLHVHTELSCDARSDAHSTSTYDGSYRIGRYRYSLDFQANADHHFLNGQDYGEWHWEEMKRITNEMNEPGRFVTIIANELSHDLGHQNVYFLGGDPPFLRTEEKNHPYDLWELLDGHECFCVPHHVAQSMAPWQWEHFNAAIMPVVEIFSNHGRAEFPGNTPHHSPHPIPTLEGHTWVEQLNTGKKLGAIASGDDHWARPGTVGLTGVWAEKLERDEIYHEIKARHCYATTAARVILHYRVNGAEMGSIIRSDHPPGIDLLAASPDTIEKAEIIKNGVVVFGEEPGGLMTELQWTDEEFADSAYYYVRLTLKPDPNAEEYMVNKQQFIWSSPVWVTAGAMDK